MRYMRADHVSNGGIVIIAIDRIIVRSLVGVMNSRLRGVEHGGVGLSSRFGAFGYSQAPQGISRNLGRVDRVVELLVGMRGFEKA